MGVRKICSCQDAVQSRGRMPGNLRSGHEWSDVRSAAVASRINREIRRFTEKTKIPEDVIAAKRQLVELGFADHLISEVAR
jgi:hypothetical protein